MSEASEKTQSFRSMEYGEETLREMYMKSPFLVWRNFAESLGIDYRGTINDFPTKRWQDEKRTIIAQKNADELMDAVFSCKHRWQKEVLDAIKELPETGKAIHAILRKKINYINDRMKAWDEQKKKDPTNSKTKKDPFSVGSLSTLAHAYSTLVEAQHRALLISDKSFGITEKLMPKELSQSEEETPTSNFVIEMTDGKQVSINQYEEYMKEYLDQKPLPKDQGDES